MAAIPSDDTNLQPLDSSSEAAEKELLQSLRRKEGNWVAWGQACQQLQKSGYSPQKIFEATGFEPIQQNQIIVAAQVFQSLVSGGATPEILARYERTGSDSLYEFRILSQAERIAAATIAVEKSIDSEGAREVAKALKEFSRLSNPPKEFTGYASDAIAYYYWKLARQQSDLQARSRLIAQGLRFAQSEAARRQVESLLTDFTVTRTRPAPRFPFYRFESAEEQPIIIPVVGKLPLTVEEFKTVPLTIPEGVFNIIKFSGTGAWIALPGWQVARSSEDPVMIIVENRQLDPDSTAEEEMMIMVDRAQRQWDADSYFVIERSGELAIDWFEELPEEPLLGRVVLVLRPKKVLDEDFNKDLWQIEE